MTKFRLILAVLISLFLVSATYATNIAVNEKCSLVDAITAANKDEAVGSCNAGNGADVVLLLGDVRLQRALPLVTSEITIEGAGYSIVGNGRTHIFGVNNRGKLTLNMLNISNGRSSWGGAIGNLGGRLTITNSTIIRSSAEQGGAVGNEGTLTISNSTIRNNLAEEKGGAIYNSGGTITITSSSIVSNSSQGSAGAVYNDGGTVNISYSNFALNKAGDRLSGWGGAIHNVITSGEEGRVTVVASSFSNNSATADGGAIYSCCGDLSIVSSTFIDNLAGEYGGALYFRYDYDVTIRNSTFYGNSAEEKDGGGIYVENGDTGIKLLNTVVAGSKNSSDCFGRLAKNVGNLIGDGSCFAELSGDPLLGELVEPEDGTPVYYPLLEGSPAIDAGSDEFCEETDQIGTARPQGGGCDIGAIEFVGEDD